MPPMPRRCARRASRPSILAHTKKGYGMGDAGQGRMTTHQQKKLDERRPDRVPQPLPAAADRRAGHAGSTFYKPADDSARDALPASNAARRWAATMPRARRRRADACRCRRLARYAQLRAAGRRQGDEHDDGLRAPARRAAEGPGARPARRADRRRRGAHLRHGQPVQAGRHLFQRRPALRAGGHRLGAQLPRSDRRPDPRRRHQRGRRASPAGRRRPPATACTARRCCRSTSTTRCSASSASAT